MKKKLLAFLLSMVMIISLLPASAFAYDFNFDADFYPVDGQPIHFNSGKVGYAMSHIDIDADFKVPVAVNGKVFYFDPYMETTDAQYVTYTGRYADGTPAEAKLSSVGTSEDVEMQIRLGTDKIDNNNYLEAGTVDDPVYWTVTFNKTYTVYVDDTHLSTEWFEGCTEHEVPFCFSATATFWTDNNECPGGPYWQGLKDPSKKGVYDPEMEIPFEYSGIDLKLGSDYGTITIQKNVTGCKLDADKEFTFDVYHYEVDTRIVDATVNVKGGKVDGQTALVQVPYGTYYIEEVSESAQIDGYSLVTKYSEDKIVISAANPADVMIVTNQYTPIEHKLTYHVIPDEVYGIPEDSKTPDPVPGIPHGGEVILVDADGTVKTTQTYAEVGDKKIPGTWTFVEHWTEDGTDPDKADITTDKVSNITEDKDVYGQWKFIPDPEPVDVQFSGMKVLEGRTLADKEFSFTLSGNGTSETVKNDADGKITFSKLTFTKAGTYTYTVKEEATTEAGVTIDSKIYNITVTVTDDGAGHLTATITGTNADGSGLNFTNGYEAKPVDVQFSGMKVLEGRTLADQEFSFTLNGSGTSETVKNEADGKITFSKLTFTKTGTYTYTVKEEATTEDGVTIDSKIYNITVTVTDDGSGQLKASISGDTMTGTDLNFKNTYIPGSTSVTLSGTKTFNNFPADSAVKPVFTFTLSENGSVIDTKTVEKEGDFAFDSITYTEAGTHTYTVVETKGTQSGVIYDTRTYTVTVKVADNKAGALVATIEGINADGSGLNFTNGYEAKPVDVQFSGMKVLEGRDLADKEFSFTLSGNGTSETVKNDADGKITFSKLTFTKAGTYTYTVKEEATTEAGVTIDSKIYNITVSVTDDGAGHLTAAITGINADGSGLNFTNGYEAKPVDVQFSGMKTLEGRDLADKEFSFTLNGNGTSETVKNDADGKITFSKLTFTKAGTYTYTVKEEATTEDGVTIDSKIYNITVTVTDDGAGHLTAAITGTNADGSGLNFTNGYEAKPVDVQFSGMKVLEGRTLADQEFSFTLSGNGTSETVKNEADGKITFSKLTFTKTGTYTYTVKEEATTEAGVTIDSKIYNITVTVTDDGSGQLKAAISGDTTTGTDLNFKNTYKAGSTSVTLSGTKTFNNFPADSTIKPLFTFTLSENGSVIDTKTVEKQGDFAFNSITYTEAGTHTYVVAEKKGEQAGVSYDTRTYTVTVKVADNKTGALVATIEGINADGSGLNFTNGYDPKPVDVQLSGMKTLEGRDLADKEFSFTLSGSGTSETVKNEADGKITFSKLTFTKAGTYTYTVKEEATTEDGVTIDSKIYNITVTVTDDGSGQLKASISGDTLTGSDLNFKNTYYPVSTSDPSRTYVILSGHKTFNNFPADSEIKPVFTFTLSENGSVIDTKTVEKQGDFAFNSITYTEAGTHTYTVVETKGTQSGVIYDTRSYTVRVKVKDNLAGSLVATIEGINADGSGLNFTNEYEAKPVDVQFSGMKTLEGKELKENEFSFTLNGENDGTNETVTNAADGKISFSQITFTKTGTYTYTVKEEATTEDGVTIDSKIYNITVTVTDDGSGQLKAAISGDTMTGSDLNFTNKYIVGGSTFVILGGTKIFENFPADSTSVPEFTFTLSEDGEIIDTTTVSGQGAYGFDSITYTEEGVHTYTVAETAGHQDGVTYDDTIYTVTVTVKDDGNGKLAAAISGDSTTGSDLDFRNKYEEEPEEETPPTPEEPEEETPPTPEEPETEPIVTSPDDEPTGEYFIDDEGVPRALYVNEFGEEYYLDDDGVPRAAWHMPKTGYGPNLDWLLFGVGVLASGVMLLALRKKKKHRG